MNKLQRVTIKSITDDAVTVAGYGVIFGGVDLDGETFGPDTDYMLDLVPRKPVLYDHGMNGKISKAIIGMVGKAEPDDTGLWVEAELDRHNDYMAAILELIEKGALGWSSGTIGQLAMREGKSIKRWPIVELSLTPTPAEPRTLGVEQLKALAELMPAIDSIVAEAAEPEPEPATDESQPAAETPADDIAVAPEDEDEAATVEAENTAPEAQSAEPTPEPEDDLSQLVEVLGEFTDAIRERIERMRR